MGEEQIVVKIGEKEKTYPAGVSFLSIAQEYQDQYEDDIVLALYNNRLRELKKTVKKDGDSWAVEGYDLIPCRLSSTDSKNDYRPRPYKEDEEGYARVLSKLDGFWTGNDLNVDYSFMYR